MENKLALIEPAQYGIMEKLAKIATGSGYANKTEVQALFVMLKGFELGISPMQALDGITVIQNKTTVSPQLMLALINRSGELADLKIEGDSARCTVTMTRKGRSPHTETFGMMEATAMQLAHKDNWKKQPAVMLKWRAVSACARVVFPDVIQGMYTPEEMGAEVSEDESGNVIIDAPIVEQKPRLPEPRDIQDKEVEGLLDIPVFPKGDHDPFIDGLTVGKSTPAPSTPAQPEKTATSQPDATTDVWKYDAPALFMALGNDAYASKFNSNERANTAKKINEEGGFANVATIGGAVALVNNRLKMHEQKREKTG